MLLKNSNYKSKFSSVLSIFLLISVNALPSLISKTTIKGKITDADTGEPLFNVNIFLANTTIGAASGENGEFFIERVPAGGFDLVFSRIGYEIKIIPIKITQPKHFFYDIKLKSKPIKGEEVKVEARPPTKWRRDYKKFKELFLGQSENSRKCKILNPYVLNFALDPITGEFVAFSDSTLRIDNRALGYRLFVVLDKFRSSADKLIYGAYIRYKELIAKNESEKERWLKIRLLTYKGSFRHFLLALVQNKLKAEQFEIYNVYSLESPQAWYILDPDSTDLFLSDYTNSAKKLYFENYLGIVYRGVGSSDSNKIKSIISLNFPYVEIDSLGNLLSPYAVTQYGYWSKERIAGFLPLDYRPHK